MPETTTGDAAAETATTTDTVTATTAQQTAEPETDLAAEVEKWKEQSRKQEARAKANAKAATELEELRRTSMTEQERAADEARAAGKAEGLREAGSRLVTAEVRAAAKGRVADIDALLEVLDPAKFLDDDGEPDTAQINAWVDRFAPEDAMTAFPDLGQGARSTAPGLGSDQLLNDVKAKLGIR